MTKQKIATRASKLAQALKSNKKKAKGDMANKAGGRCCLCVAEDVAVTAGAADKQMDRTTSLFPNHDTRKYFGWNNVNPQLYLNQGRTKKWYASEINDANIAVPHRIIAEFFLLTFQSTYKLSPEAKKYGEKLIEYKKTL